MCLWLYMIFKKISESFMSMHEVNTEANGDTYVQKLHT